jgi:hypothetical protein
VENRGASIPASDQVGARDQQFYLIAARHLDERIRRPPSRQYAARVMRPIAEPGKRRPLMARTIIAILLRSAASTRAAPSALAADFPLSQV